MLRGRYCIGWGEDMCEQHPPMGGSIGLWAVVWAVGPGDSPADSESGTLVFVDQGHMLFD